MLEKNVQLEMPLDERYRNAEQYALDLPPPTPRTQPTLYEEQKQSCGRLGYCYCPKCNPR